MVGEAFLCEQSRFSDFLVIPCSQFAEGRDSACRVKPEPVLCSVCSLWTEAQAGSQHLLLPLPPHPA